MELQHTLRKRDRSHAVFDVPGPSPSQYPSSVDNQYGQLPTCEFQLSPEQLGTPYGHSSGLQVHFDISLDYGQKRRKISNFVSMSQEQETDQFHQEKSLASDPGHGESYQSTIVRWAAPIMELSSPCCGLLQPRGYEPIPDQPTYDPHQPYVMEEPPCMSSAPTSHRQLSASQDSPRHSSLSREHFHSPISPRTAYGANNPLVSLTSGGPSTTTPAAMEEIRYQPIQPTTGFYSDHPLDQGQHLSSPILFPPEPYLHHDQPPIQYGPIVAHGLSFVPLVDQMAGSSAVSSQYYGPGASFIQPDNLAQANDWSDGALHGHGHNPYMLLPNQRGGKRGPFRDQNLREQTAQTRRIGSCIRCRMQRIRCEQNPDDPNGGCSTCKRVANTKAGRFPCLRYKITDIRLYKPGQVPGFEWTRRWNNNISDPIHKWASSEIKTIHISEGYSSKRIELRVRRFVPQEGDKLDRTWDYRGTTKSVAIPPYALMDLEDGKLAYERHIRESMSETLRRVLVLSGSDELLCKTYLLACQMCMEPSASMEALDVLRSTLRLWVSVRLSTTSEFIIGEETLGMPYDILDETSPSPGKIPVPPVLSAQMDLILIHHIQTKLRRELLDKLQKLILKNKQSSWLVTYIVTFILLHNASLITAHDAGYARKHGMKRRFAREDKVQEYHLGANILLAHFHYCNKGIHPFSDACKDQDLRTLADLDDNKIRFVRATRSYAKQHKKEWEDIRAKGAYENDFYFVSQLFEEGWQPRSVSL